jgi:hypothetical protein
MMIHRTFTTAPYHMHSCASRVISYLTQRDDLEITHEVMQMRKKEYKWSNKRIQQSTDFIYDTEIRFLLRHLLLKTRLIVPFRKTTVLQVSRKLKKDECALVMINLHIMIVCNGCIYDTNFFGTDVEFCAWKNAKVHWYQRCKQ